MKGRMTWFACLLSLGLLALLAAQCGAENEQRHALESQSKSDALPAQVAASSVESAVNPCEGIVCDMPPGSECLDDSRLLSFSARGVCTEGACVYPPYAQPCAFGCQAGACNPDPDPGVVCDSPPPDRCKNTATILLYPAQGHKQGIECVYQPTELRCPAGCANDRCQPSLNKSPSFRAAGSAGIGIGDVNVDGFEDFVFAGTGQARIHYGSDVGIGDSAGWIFDGTAPTPRSGVHVGPLGDVNCDGKADFFVLDPSFSVGGQTVRRLVIFFGRVGGPSHAAVVDGIARATAADGDDFIVLNDDYSTTAAAGNVDGCNAAGHCCDDVLIGFAPADTAVVYTGSIQGVGEQPSWQITIECAGLPGPVGCAFGSAVATAGDINGDNHADVLISSAHFSGDLASEGVVVGFYGSAQGLAASAIQNGIPTANLADASWYVEGNRKNSNFGHALSTAGDVNNDGFDDVIIGANGFGHYRSGRVYIFHGSSAGLPITANRVLSRSSQMYFTQFGSSVSTAGDVNNDGFDDVIVGAYNYSRTADDVEYMRGVASVYPGSAQGIKTAKIWDVTGLWSEEHFGKTVTPAGDVIASDGWSDFAVRDREEIFVYGVGLNRPPRILSLPPCANDCRVRVGDVFYYQVMAEDPDRYDEVRFIRKPYSWLRPTIDAREGVLRIAPENRDIGNQTAVVRIEDRGGLYVDQPFTVIVEGCNTPPPDYCRDGSTLVKYEYYGQYDQDGQCVYQSQAQSCTYGCAQGDCVRPQCSSGSCCENGLYRPADFQCGTTALAERVFCSADECGSQVVQQKKYAFCTGSSASCGQQNPRWVDTGSVQHCATNEICVTGDAGQVGCQACAHGCALGACLLPVPSEFSDLAPPLPSTGVCSFAQSVAFLYTGQNPIQFGADPAAFEAERLAVLRGKVEDRAGLPIGDVGISVQGHPEFGATRTLPNGEFFLAVNGGQRLVVAYHKDARLPVQRKVKPQAKGFSWLPDVVMIPLDAQVSTIDLSGMQAMQVARASAVADAHGQRRATVLFPDRTEASLVFPDGRTEAINQLHVRATEYTLGDSGLQAMPGELPPASAYTYAVELSVDEALAAGAESVRFNQTVVFFVENFLDFPVGGAVPTGFYDRRQAAWLPLANGRVIQILDVVAAKAVLDLDGDGQADSGLELGVTDEELKQLAQLYQIGQSLWRVPLHHFTPIDCNWPFVWPEGMRYPDWFEAVREKLEDEGCKSDGSIIECNNRVLGERIGIAGTPFTLNYRTSRQKGFEIARMLRIPLTGEDLPPGLQGVELDIQVAGRRFSQSFPARTNQSATFVWDGKDAFGRQRRSRQSVRVQVGYIYHGEYLSVPFEFEIAFGYRGLAVKLAGAPLARQRAKVVAWQFWAGAFDPLDPPIQSGQKMGGWTLDAQAAYDPVGKVVYFGGGDRLEGQLATRSIRKVADHDNQRVLDYTVGPDGSLYLSVDSNPSRGCFIKRITPDGLTTIVAGKVDSCRNYYDENWVDGSLATQTELYYDIRDMAIGPDGSIYLIQSQQNRRVLRITPEGLVRVIAGGNNPQAQFGQEGIPATEARLGVVKQIEVASDGSVYFSEYETHYRMLIRRIGTAGTLRTVAGCLQNCVDPSDGEIATRSRNLKEYFALNADDEPFVATYNAIYEVTPQGRLRVVVGGGGCYYPYCCDGDGCRASDYHGNIHQIDFGPDGSLYFANATKRRVYKLGPGGRLLTQKVAHAGAIHERLPIQPNGELTVDQAGYLYVDENSYYTPPFTPGVYKIGDRFSDSSATETSVPLGAASAVFDQHGRHQKTLDSLTGQVLQSFQFDHSGVLASTTDNNGLKTRIERDAQGKPTAIVGPFGQRTKLVVGTSGYLERIESPSGKAHRFEYDSNGLLVKHIDAKNQEHRFEYDAFGRLEKDSHPSGSFQTLNREAVADGYLVRKSTRMGRQTTYQVRRAPGTTARVATFPSGVSNRATEKDDGSHRFEFSNGMEVFALEGPDPRWGMQEPMLKELRVKTPAGLEVVSTFERTIHLTDPADRLSLQRSEESVTVNGRTYTTVYQAQHKRITDETPMGRRSVVWLDGKARVSKVRAADLAPLEYQYNPQGQLTKAIFGTGAGKREYSFSYDASGHLMSLTDPLQRTTSYEYDQDGRPTKKLLSDGRQIHLSYDENGNITSITPPGRPAHGFAYKQGDLTEAYLPPKVGPGIDKTQYAYNPDGQLDLVTRPDGKTIDLEYDSAGRISRIIVPRGAFTYEFNNQTGQLASIAAPDGNGLWFWWDGSLPTATAWTGDVAGTLQREYDDNLRVVGMRVNNTNRVGYEYDRDGLLTKAGDMVLTRDPGHGMLMATSLGNATTTCSYNSFGEWKVFQGKHNQAILYELNLGRDVAGRIVQKAETIDGITRIFDYTYDQVGRLAQVHRDGVRISDYDYDLNSNRIAYLDENGAAVTGVYDEQDRLLQYADVAYTYTANGELATKTVAGQTTTYTYDVSGNLRRVSLPDGSQIDYFIDARNRRIGKGANGILQKGFLYQNQLNPVAELDAVGELVSLFVFGDRGNVPAYMVSRKRDGITWSVYRIFADHLGSPRLVVDVDTGEVVQRMDHDEFGRVVQDTNPEFQPFGFAGGIYDSQTGLVRFGARDYDPTVGRWTAKDPILFGGGSTNLYGYVMADPVGWVDPAGLEPIGGYPEWIENDLSPETMRGYRTGYLIITGVVAAAAGGAYAITALSSSAIAAEAAAAAVALWNRARGIFMWLRNAVCGSATRAAGGAQQAARALDPNKLYHIFGKAGHNLGPLVQKLGSQEATFRAVESATQTAVRSQGLSGVFTTTVKVAGQDVVVRGRVMEGVANIGSFWIP